MAKHSNAKLIIELSAKNTSRREIARTRHISAHTIKEVLDRASEKGCECQADFPAAGTAVGILDQNGIGK